MTIGEKTREGVQNAGHENANTESPVVPPEATADEMFDDFLKQLWNEDDILPLGDDVFDGLLQANDSNPLDDVLLEVLKEMEEGELREVVADTPSQSVTKDATSTVPFATNSSETGNVEDELGGKMGVVNPIPPSENCSNSSFSFPQSNPNAWNQPSGMNNTTVGFGNLIFPDTAENSLNQFQSPSFPMLTCGSSSSSIHQPFPKPLQFQAIGITIRGTPAMKHRCNQGLVSPPPPSLTDFHSFVCAWQGCLIGKVYSNRESLNVAKAVRKPTSPVTLAADWRSTLRIVCFLPTKTVNYTLKICGGAIDYVFFHITEFNNLDVYEHLSKKKVCAKVELPSETIILSATESKYHFLGTIIPRDIVFIQPV
ncbi:mediator of RNA polymerase II transcription subunit 25 [Vigna radiata var. radiata]|uniref:Mediator of RNA polymerase II transcription subunit 25 n=1 Tax=Vigna radiata var. radiata TaxID=3916 RepID=A0A1S3UJM8_VIGRR|nr:mediator of RNA polymerase II transcription subunit 25 [Vigna radiata var. radiata]